MKLALLGADATTLAIARAAVAGPHDLVWVCELDDGEPAIASALRAVAAHSRPAEHWETLLDFAAVDAVVIARSADEDRRGDQLRKFVQAGMPMIAAHPVVQSMLVYYELDMIRRETNCVMLAYLPVRWHASASELARWLREPADSPLGRIEQVVMERRLSDRSQAAVVAQFARDVDLMRFVCGDFNKLGAMGGASEAAAYGSLGVQMTGPTSVLARWSVGPPDPTEGASLTLLGANGKAVLRLPGDSLTTETFPAVLEVTTGAETTREEFPAWNPAAAAIERLERAIAEPTAASAWVDASRSIELAETIERSLRKGRTVELHYEDYTEESTFKGTMASLGCGLLMLGLVLLGLVAVADQLKLPFVDRWPKLLAWLLGIFLALQLLMLIFKREPRDKIP